MSAPEGMADLTANSALQSDVAQKLQIDALQKSLAGGGDAKEAKLRKACQGFESVFISKLFAQMRATVPKDGILHGQYEDQYYSMFDKAMCDKMAESGGIGLADMMYRQLKSRVTGSGETAGTGDVLPANRPVGRNGSGVASDRVPMPATGMPSGPHSVPPQNLSPAVTAALARPGTGLLAPSHQPAAGSSQNTDDITAEIQAAEPMAAPTTGSITSEYGWRTDPFKGKQAWHAGMDIAAAEGDSVAACWDGTVTYAGAKGGYGNVVEIEHAGGWKSVYGHLRNYDVAVGETVTAGGKIAEVGSTGRSTGPHLHFEMRRGSQTVDPHSLLAQAGVLQESL
ncbi:peptidoglycan DD-metalloendopeptidase family protein [Desulfovibrio sp. TomC]|uniref:peptidoglycan DD-metalloendopeptidase family protein n=1 Tax=Desulfovibrio sp. TomC TaxID=1562888 RepID=UPI0005734033|nr:peptidoglycan DD-metalloendopeptidase family protein [Desulfovibrio sp. TomC]KHK02156.1 Flagellar protein FlgJ (peptidoglycan hydrolase) [Desulfovibrio sp. TomC]